jgi:hypothetical protein
MLHRDHASSRAELLVGANDCWFRTMGHLKWDGRLAIRAVTEAGHQVLRDLLAEVAKLHVAVSTLLGVHRRQDTELVRNQARLACPG